MGVVRVSRIGADPTVMKRKAQRLLIAGVIAACLTGIFVLPLGLGAEGATERGAGTGQYEAHATMHHRTTEMGPWLP